METSAPADPGVTGPLSDQGKAPCPVNARELHARKDALCGTISDALPLHVLRLDPTSGPMKACTQLLLH